MIMMLINIPGHIDQYVFFAYAYPYAVFEN